MNSNIRDYVLVSLSTVSAIALCAIAVLVGIKFKSEQAREVNYWLIYKMSVTQGGNAKIKIPFHSLNDCVNAVHKLTYAPGFTSNNVRFVTHTCIPTRLKKSNNSSSS